MLRAINLTMRHLPLQKLPITPKILRQLCKLCDQQNKIGRTLKAAYLMLYFSFMRQSSMVPRTATQFDQTRHMARADIFFESPGYIILLKWTKTMQYGKTTLLPVPQINHRHCPVKAMVAMLNDQPTSKDTKVPLFIVPDTNFVPLTSKYLSEALQIMLNALNIQEKLYSLHSFRRGGATAAFHAGVNFTQIKRHGTWASDCFWEYVTNSTLAKDVPQALAKTFM